MEHSDPEPPECHVINLKIDVVRMGNILKLQSAVATTVHRFHFLYVLHCFQHIMFLERVWLPEPMDLNRTPELQLVNLWIESFHTYETF